MTATLCENIYVDHDDVDNDDEDIDNHDEPP